MQRQVGLPEQELAPTTVFPPSSRGRRQGVDVALKITLPDKSGAIDVNRSQLSGLQELVDLLSADAEVLGTLWHSVREAWEGELVENDDDDD